MVDICVDFGHSGPTPEDDITDCGNFTLDFKQLGILCLPSLPPDSRTLIFLNAKFTFTWKRGLWTTERQTSFFSLLSPGKTLLTLCLVQEWSDRRNAAVAASVLDTSVQGGSCCTDSCLGKLLVRLPQILEWPLLDNPLSAAVIPIAWAHFLHKFPSTQLFMNMLGYNTLWTAIASLAMTLRIARVSMTVFCTTVQSAVFPMIVKATEPDWETI